MDVKVTQDESSPVVTTGYMQAPVSHLSFSAVHTAVRPKFCIRVMLLYLVVDGLIWVTDVGHTKSSDPAHVL